MQPLTINIPFTKKDYNLLTRSIIGKDFLMALFLKNPQPGNNELLDYRIYCEKLKEDENIFVPYCDLEIQAIDIILKFLNDEINRSSKYRLAKELHKENIKYQLKNL